MIVVLVAFILVLLVFLILCIVYPELGATLHKVRKVSGGAGEGFLEGFESVIEKYSNLNTEFYYIDCENITNAISKSTVIATNPVAYSLTTTGCSPSVINRYDEKAIANAFTNEFKKYSSSGLLDEDTSTFKKDVEKEIEKAKKKGNEIKDVNAEYKKKYIKLIKTTYNGNFMKCLGSNEINLVIADFALINSMIDSIVIPIYTETNIVPKNIILDIVFKLAILIFTKKDYEYVKNACKILADDNLNNNDYYVIAKASAAYYAVGIYNIIEKVMLSAPVMSSSNCEYCTGCNSASHDRAVVGLMNPTYEAFLSTMFYNDPEYVYIISAKNNLKLAFLNITPFPFGYPIIKMSPLDFLRADVLNRHVASNTTMPRSLHAHNLLLDRKYKLYPSALIANFIDIVQDSSGMYGFDMHYLCSNSHYNMLLDRYLYQKDPYIVDVNDLFGTSGYFPAKVPYNNNAKIIILNKIRDMLVLCIDYCAILRNTNVYDKMSFKTFVDNKISTIKNKRGVDAYKDLFHLSNCVNLSNNVNFLSQTLRVRTNLTKSEVNNHLSLVEQNYGNVVIIMDQIIDNLVFSGNQNAKIAIIGGVKYYRVAADQYLCAKNSYTYKKTETSVVETIAIDNNTLLNSSYSTINSFDDYIKSTQADAMNSVIKKISVLKNTKEEKKIDDKASLDQLIIENINLVGENINVKTDLGSISVHEVAAEVYFKYIPPLIKNCVASKLHVHVDFYDKVLTHLYMRIYKEVENNLQTVKIDGKTVIRFESLHEEFLQKLIDRLVIAKNKVLYDKFALKERRVGFGDLTLDKIQESLKSGYLTENEIFEMFGQKIVINDISKIDLNRTLAIMGEMMGSRMIFSTQIDNAMIYDSANWYYLDPSNNWSSGWGGGKDTIDPIHFVEGCDDLCLQILAGYSGRNYGRTNIISYDKYSDWFAYLNYGYEDYKELTGAYLTKSKVKSKMTGMTDTEMNAALVRYKECYCGNVFLDTAPSFLGGGGKLPDEDKLSVCVSLKSSNATNHPPCGKVGGYSKNDTNMIRWACLMYASCNYISTYGPAKKTATPAYPHTLKKVNDVFVPDFSYTLESMGLTSPYDAASGKLQNYSGEIKSNSSVAVLKNKLLYSATYAGEVVLLRQLGYDNRKSTNSYTTVTNSRKVVVRTIDQDIWPPQ